MGLEVSRLGVLCELAAGLKMPAYWVASQTTRLLLAHTNSAPPLPRTTNPLPPPAAPPHQPGPLVWDPGTMRLLDYVLCLVQLRRLGPNCHSNLNAGARAYPLNYN